MTTFMEINKCLVVSNDETLNNEVVELLLKMPYLSRSLVVRTFSELLKELSEFSPTCIIIDTDTISLAKVNDIFGISPRQVSIVVLSSSTLEAVECYDQGLVTDFILKPLNFPRLRVALNRALKSYISFSGMTGVDYVFLKVGRSFLKFQLDEIIYIEAFGIYVKLYTSKGKTIVNDSISRVEKRLEHHDFIRVHKSYIINTKKIISFNSSAFELTLGKIPIGPNYKFKLDALLAMLSKTHNGLDDYRQS
jgi:two-component system response regulator LytT